MFLDWGAADDVFLEDALDHFGSDRVIPDAVGIDDCDGAVLADAEAVGFGSEDAFGALHEAEFREALFEVVPTGDAGVFVAAFGLGLVCAEEDMAADGSDAEIRGDLDETLFVVGSHRN